MSFLLFLAAFFFVLWIVGLVVRFTMGGLVHAALVIAVVLVVVWLMKVVLRVL
jgi:hypothetical protein